jgi:hypothetical protein
MGFLSWLNRNANEVRDTAIIDRGFKAPTGAAAQARIVGIEQRLDDGTTKRYITVAHGGRVSGIEVAHGPAALVARLHLGAEVRIADGVLDTQEIAQKVRRKPPAAGVVDKTVSGGDQKKLKKWTPRRATIIALNRRDSAFGPSLNFDVSMRLEDGGEVVAARTEIPFYAAWLAAPGVEVPVVVDDGRAVIDWAAAANEPNRPAGGPDDPPPPGSAAALF